MTRRTATRRAWISGCCAGATFLAGLPLAASSQRASRPSAPSPPHEESVRFTSDGITLVGTLVLPGGAGRHPAVVIFHGSGPQPRDLYTARWFAAHGVAAVTYDKRGVGESGGDFNAVPFMDLCDDGLAALAFLKARTDIDPKRIGVWGLSQGGWLAPLAASRSPDVAFVIAVSGPGVSPGEQMIVYYANELRAEGVAESDVRAISAFRRDVWNYFATGVGYDRVSAEVQHARTTRWYELVNAQQDDVFRPLPTPAKMRDGGSATLRWYRQDMNYDPIPALRGIHVPALFIFGDRDRLIPVPQSLAVVRRVLAEGAHHDFTIRELPNAEHGMQLATGETDPAYLEAMRAWLMAHVLKVP